jgi:hypothetical protein
MICSSFMPLLHSPPAVALGFSTISQPMVPSSELWKGFGSRLGGRHGSNCFDGYTGLLMQEE